MFYKVFMFMVIGLLPSILFGFITHKRFGALSAPQFVDHLRSRKLKAATLLFVVLAWPVLIMYLSFNNPAEFHLIQALLAFALGVIAVLAGAVWQKSERKEEREKHLFGEGSGY
jgi:Na+/proline symporter